MRRNATQGIGLSWNEIEFKEDLVRIFQLFQRFNSSSVLLSRYNANMHFCNDLLQDEVTCAADRSIFRACTKRACRRAREETERLLPGPRRDSRAAYQTILRDEISGRGGHNATRVPGTRCRWGRWGRRSESQHSGAIPWPTRTAPRAAVPPYTSAPTPNTVPTYLQEACICRQQLPAGKKATTPTARWSWWTLRQPATAGKSITLCMCLRKVDKSTLNVSRIV
jgi:hypothetical protein